MSEQEKRKVLVKLKLMKSLQFPSSAYLKQHLNSKTIEHIREAFKILARNLFTTSKDISKRQQTDMIKLFLAGYAELGITSLNGYGIPREVIDILFDEHWTPNSEWDW